jgi:hypothetical protein
MIAMGVPIELDGDTRPCATTMLYPSHMDFPLRYTPLAPDRCVATPRNRARYVTSSRPDTPGGQDVRARVSARREAGV